MFFLHLRKLTHTVVFWEVQLNASVFHQKKSINQSRYITTKNNLVV